MVFFLKYVGGSYLPLLFLEPWWITIVRRCLGNMFLIEMFLAILSKSKDGLKLHTLAQE